MFPFNHIVKSLASRHLHRVICFTPRASHHLRRSTCVTSFATHHVRHVTCAVSRQESRQKLAGRTNLSLPYQGWCTLSTLSWSHGYIKLKLINLLKIFLLLLDVKTSLIYSCYCLMPLYGSQKKINMYIGVIF